MAKFKVVHDKGFWDGVSLHPRGTIIEIGQKDYGVLLNPGLEGVDAEASKALKDRYGDSARTREASADDLDPSKLDDRRKMAEMIPHARVVQEAPRPKVE